MPCGGPEVLLEGITRGDVAVELTGPTLGVDKEVEGAVEEVAPGVDGLGTSRSKQLMSWSTKRVRKVYSLPSGKENRTRSN